MSEMTRPSPERDGFHQLPVRALKFVLAEWLAALNTSIESARKMRPIVRRAAEIT
jgi:hypothetical protein